MKRIADIITLKPFVNTLPATDLVSRQKMRLFMIATLMSLLVCIGFIIQVMLILPGMPLLQAAMFMLFCGIFINFFAILAHKKPAISYVILLSIWYILIHVNTYFSGGVKNSGNFYLATVILTAFILMGSKGGKVMAALSILHIVYFYFITTYTNLVNYVLVGEGEALLNVYFLFSTSVSLFILAGESNYIEKSKNAVVESLHLKNEELIDASRRLQLATGAAKIGIWDRDLINDKITWDSTMYSLYALTDKREMNYSQWQQMVHPVDLVKVLQQLEWAIKEEKNFESEYRIIWPDQSVRHIKTVAQILCDNKGAPLRILGAAWDITESKKAAEALIKSNQRYELATRATSNAIWDWNLLTGEHYWSEGYLLTFGHTTAGMSESFETYASRIHPNDYERVHKGLLDILKGESGDYWEDEYRFQKADGSWAHVYDRGYLVFDAQNKPVRFVGAMQDITSRKGIELERELIIHELIKSNAHLKQFSFITSHNLRSPLSNISAILDLIDYAPLDSHNRQMLDMLRVSGKQLGNTIDDLTKILLIRNNNNAEITSINVNDTLNEIKTSFSASLADAGGRINTNITTPYVSFHKVYFESMLINLISNSIKYRSPDRRLIINIDLHCESDENCVLTFSDNGIGIDMERYKDRIFGLYQRFHQTSEGQGLGLFIIKSQIEALGGEITLRSEVDKGATFTIIFKKPVASVRSSHARAELV